VGVEDYVLDPVDLLVDVSVGVVETVAAAAQSAAIDMESGWECNLAAWVLGYMSGCS
jgi:hypothetical protein